MTRDRGHDPPKWYSARYDRYTNDHVESLRSREEDYRNYTPWSPYPEPPPGNPSPEKQS